MGYECDEDVQIQAYFYLDQKQCCIQDLVLVHPEDKQLIDGIMDLILETVYVTVKKYWLPVTGIRQTGKK